MAGPGKRVLLVDDEPTVVGALELFLRRSGHQVGSAASAEEALERLGAGDFYDVLLVDKNLPGMSGIELVRRARGLKPHVPAIVMTGYPSVQSSRDADEAGACAYLIKPFKSLDELRETIERVAPAGPAGDERFDRLSSSLSALTERLRRLNAKLGDKS